MTKETKTIFRCKKMVSQLSQKHSSLNEKKDLDLFFYLEES